MPGSGYVSCMTDVFKSFSKCERLAERPPRGRPGPAPRRAQKAALCAEISPVVDIIVNVQSTMYGVT